MKLPDYIQILEEFCADANLNYPMQRARMTNLPIMQSAVRDALVDDDPAMVRDLLERGLRAALGGLLGPRLELPVIGDSKQVAQRVSRNLAGLLATARVVLEAKAGTRDKLLEAISVASKVVGNQDAPEGSHPLSSNLGGPTVVDTLVDALKVWDESSLPLLSILYWSLFWLDEEKLAFSASEVGDDLQWLRVPIVGYRPETGEGEVAHLLIARILDCRRPELVEHPQSSLRGVDPTFMNTLQTNWRSTGATPAVWQIVAPAGSLFVGDSIDLATRVGFQSLAMPHPQYRSDAVLLGLVDGPRLQPVGHVEVKLKAAAKANLYAARIAKQTPSLLTSSFLMELKTMGMTDIREIGMLREALDFASGRTTGPGEGGKIYLGRFRLEMTIGNNKSLWSATQIEGVPRGRSDYCLVRLYSFEKSGTGAEEFYRTAWSRDLRTISRLANCPGAADFLLMLRQAGTEQESGCFVLALESSAGTCAPAAEYLAPALRAKTNWLQSRAEVWRGLQRIAEAIRILHTEHLLHRNISAETVFCSDSGPDSFRLGGIDGSLRVTSLEDPSELHRSAWVRPPEAVDASSSEVYGNSIDWYGFGMLAARLLLPLENLKDELSPKALNDAVNDRIARADLTVPEREFLRRLIAQDIAVRVDRSGDALFNIQEILKIMRQPAAARRQQVSFAAVLTEDQTVLRILAQRASLQRIPYVADMARPQDPFDPAKDRHRATLRDWIKRDLREGFLFGYYSAGDLRYGISGATLVYYLSPYQNSWDLAELRSREMVPDDLTEEMTISLDRLFIQVYDRKNDFAIGVPVHREWTSVLPKERELTSEEMDGARFQQFLRITNQIELLMQRDEVYGYECDLDRDLKMDRDGAERLVIRPDQLRQPPARSWTRPQSMLEFFNSEIESGRSSGQVILRASEQNSRDQEDEEPWTIERFIWDRNELVLTRPVKGELPFPRGVILTEGYTGQIRLIERRREAINRLGSYGYLIRALIDPRSVGMNTGAKVELDAVFDGRPDDYHDKPDRLNDILQSIPIYALEGPPGTGKSTLTAFVVRALLVDDPGLQILITAQAHGAVDVLRERVDRAFAGLQQTAERRPVAIRLGLKSIDGRANMEGLREAARQSLQDSVAAFAKREPSSKAAQVWAQHMNELLVASDQKQKSWLETCDDLEVTEPAQQTVKLALRRYEELLRQSANIIYTTTSARDLNYLARSQQRFDWVIVEEAGKAHGFDLALPLQAGHRWVLIGDSRQLPPYRYEDFERALKSIHKVNNDLQELRKSTTGLVDYAWLNWWERLSKTDQQKFASEFAPAWLPTFSQISQTLQATDFGDRRPWGRLEVQFRMHPDIGSLISEAFYSNSLKNADQTATLKHSVRHARVSPKDLAIVWIDLPLFSDDNRFREQSDSPYFNQQEAEAVKDLLAGLIASENHTLVVLSPYSRQVRELNERLANVACHPCLRFKQSLSNRRNREARVHTVDSFQGNEADIVIISMVRNNDLAPPKGLGFLKESWRMNVLASRAARLLIFVGSWEFFQRQVRDCARPEVAEIRTFMKLLGRYREKKQLLFVPWRVAKKGSTR
jgi:hypothetical protein